MQYEKFLTEQEIQVLEADLRECKEIRHSDRIKAILSLNEGYDFQVAANLLRLDDSPGSPLHAVAITSAFSLTPYFGG